MVILLVCLSEQKTRATSLRNRSESRQICQGNRLSAHFFLPRLHNKKMLDLENEGHGQGVQNLQWCYSIANIKLCKRHMLHICDRSHRFSYINVSNLWPWKWRSVLWSSTTFLMTPFDAKYQPLKSHSWAFYANLLPFSRCSKLKFLTLKSYVKVMIYNTRNGASRWQMHDFLSVFAFSSLYLLK